MARVHVSRDLLLINDSLAWFPLSYSLFIYTFSMLQWMSGVSLSHSRMKGRERCGKLDTGKGKRNEEKKKNTVGLTWHENCTFSFGSKFSYAMVQHNPRTEHCQLNERNETKQNGTLNINSKQPTYNNCIATSTAAAATATTHKHYHEKQYT